MSNTLRNVILGAMILAFVVIVLGAYVRLTDAGLGCPDWPGCYGILMGVPTNEVDIAQANSDYERAVEVGKAWREMIHRYFAGVLGCLILIISVFLMRKDSQGQRHIFSGIALGSLLLFQAALGMWTVTMQLKPLIVMGHLLGGFTLFNLLGWQYLRGMQSLPVMDSSVASKLFNFSVVAIIVLVGQIALGGWVSSNYAALACTDFPTCQQQWWPQMDFANGFVMWRGLGVDYEYGVLEHPARVAIHYTHRIGAVVVLLVLGRYLHLLAKNTKQVPALRNIARIGSVLLLVQIILGISNIVYKLPLGVAVAHNGVALLLLFSIVSSAYMLRSAKN